jgi:hypothetical protein
VFLLVRELQLVAVFIVRTNVDSVYNICNRIFEPYLSEVSFIKLRYILLSKNNHHICEIWRKFSLGAFYPPTSFESGLLKKYF